ncbi:MAG: hypothetical protein WB919_18455 [Candidatus Sulfotelmatobacter sp.]
MKRSLFPILFAIAIRVALAAQDVPHVVSSDVNCAVSPRRYEDWYQQTHLPEHKPYVAPEKRRQQILENYHGLRLQMGLDDVERLLGKPDFGTARPPLRLATAPGPTNRECANDLAYIVRKNGENMVDMEDVAVYLSFSPNEKLYWAAPQNLPTLKPLGSPSGKAPSIVQSQASWKEYVFATDGFGITLPGNPQLHADTTLAEFTVYSVPLPDNSMLSLRVSHQTRDCAATLAELKDGALKGKSGIDPSSVKSPAINGEQGLEYEYAPGPDRVSLDRFYCVSGRFYAFSTTWFGTQALPASVERVLSSFHLLGTERPGGPQ